MVGKYLKFFVLAAALCLPALSSSLSATDGEETTYVNKIGKIFSLHMQSIEQLMAEKSPFSENVVRHALGLLETASMLNHAVSVAKQKSPDSTWPWKDDADYERLFAANTKAVRELIKVAGIWLEGGEKAPVMQAVEGVKKTCNNCH